MWIMRVAVIAGIVVLFAGATQATMFNVGLASGSAQFLNGQPETYGQTADPSDVDLAPGVPADFVVNQFTNFHPMDVYPYSPGASLTFTQTLTVNGVPTTALRTLTLVEESSDHCTLVQSLSALSMTVDLGAAGRVTIDLPASSILAYPCDNGVPDGSIFVVVPGLFVHLTATVLDDFTSYAIKTAKGASKLAPFGPVTLADDFGSADYDVTKLLALDTPAGVNGAATFDGTTHLARYALKRRKTFGKFQKIVDLPITTECGNLAVTLAKPESLLVPVGKSLTPPPPAVPDPQTSLVDHFLCYAAKLQKKRTDGSVAATLPKKMQVGTADQFETRIFDVKKLTRVCAPVAKSGSPVDLKTGNPKAITPTTVRSPASHLVCYQVKPAKASIAQTACGPVAPKDKGAKIDPPQPKHQKVSGLVINGQLGSATLDTVKELELCVPLTAEFSSCGRARACLRGSALRADP
ncbi:MAG TPA: hypothetical protein VGK30_16080 [Candidatus Binatia bacterium]|jgi:hypothetical protein